MASAVEVVDLLSDDDDEVVAVSSYHARGAVARRRGNPMSPKASLSLRKRGLKSPNKVSAVVKRCKTPDDDVVEVFGRSPEAKYKKTNASLLEILQVFPDIDTNHATALLTKNSNHAPTVLQMIVESGLYPKQEHSQVKITQSVQPLILHRNELEKSYKYDYTSELSFEPSSVYQREAKALLAQNFRFFSQKAVDGAMATSKHHYAIAYNKLRKAIMQQDAPPKDEEQEYTQFLMMENYERGFKLARKQLKSLQAVTEIKDKCRIVISKKREACKVLVSDPILKDEMDYVMSRQRDLTRRMHAYRERKEARRKAKANDATIECNCCFTDVSLDEMVQCKDGHLFCFDCLKRHANSRIFDQGNFGTHPKTKEPATELLCMTDCGEGFLPECLQKILPPKVMSKYHEMLFQMALSNAHVDDLCTCPKCGYQAELPASEMIFRCPVADCSFESCRKCGEEPHIPLKCEEVEKKHETQGRLKVEEAISQAKIRSCPRCSKKFVKEDGCNKMTCSCGTNVCYICRADITKTGYDHFCRAPHCNHTNCGKCLLSTNDKEDDERAMREAGLKAAKELLADGTGEKVVSVNVESILKGPEPSCEARRLAQTRHVANTNPFVHDNVGVAAQPPQMAGAANLLRDAFGQFPLAIPNLGQQPYAPPPQMAGAANLLRDAYGQLPLAIPNLGQQPYAPPRRVRRRRR